MSGGDVTKRTRVLPPVWAIAVALAMLAGAAALWLRRPSRSAVTVNGRVLSVAELDVRGRYLLELAKKRDHLVLDAAREKDAFAHYRREAARMWITKEILLGEAVAKGLAISGTDEADALKTISAALAERQLTPDGYFREGPLPEAVKRADFREGILVRKYMESELRADVGFTNEEVERELADMRRFNLLHTKPGGTPPLKTDRRTAMDRVRARKAQDAFERLFRSVFGKARVRSADYPEFERCEGVAPLREKNGPAGAR